MNLSNLLQKIEALSEMIHQEALCSYEKDAYLNEIEKLSSLAYTANEVVSE